MRVAALLLRRLLTAVPVLLAVSALLFAILRALPLDPAAMSMPPTATTAEIAAQRIAMGLDQPLPIQYGHWLGDALRGDFGTSVQYRRPAGALVLAALPDTVELAAAAMLIAAALGLGGGLLLFRLRGGLGEAAGDVASLLVMSVPDFLWAIVLLLGFGVAWPVLPFVGLGEAGLGDRLAHLALPATALGLAFAPPLARVLRASLATAYAADYIRTARLRGLSETRILLRHALGNAILPTLTLMGVQFGFLFGGTMLVEVIYSIPGLGNLMVEAVRNVDLPVIQGVALAYCLAVLLINTLVDATYLLLDPRL